MATVGAPSDDSNSSAHAVEECLTAARRGEGEAFGALFELFRRHLLMLAQRELPVGLRGKLGASDIVQETALDARAGFPAFRGTTPEECYAWLRSILRNNVVDAVRRFEMSQKRHVGREIRLASNSGLRIGELLPLALGSPDGSAIRKEDAAELARVIAGLAPDYRDVLRFRYWEGLSFVEIAGRMERSPDAARKLWYRAMGCLQEAMASASASRDARTSDVNSSDRLDTAR